MGSTSRTGALSATDNSGVNLTVQTRDEYLRHAEECRRMTVGMGEEQRAALLQMAETWERLAAERGSAHLAAADEAPSSVSQPDRAS